MPGLSYKPVGFQLQELKARGDDGWTFSGYASTFGNIDDGGDVVLRGAFSETLQRRRPKLLWQHDIAEPLGKVLSLREDERGLFGEFKLSKTTRGHDAYQLLKDGAIDSMSIGYIPEDQEFSNDGIRKLLSVDLLEISVVSIPMNEEALITSVKASRLLSHTAAPAEVLTVVASEVPESIPGDRGPSILTLKLALARKRLERRGLLEMTPA